MGKKNIQGSQTQNVQVVPLSNEDRQTIFNSFSSSDIVSTIPEKYPIAITFFSFDDQGNRIIRDSFLINKNGFLSDGNPEVYISIHVKYIGKLASGEDICSIIKEANKNGDLAFHSNDNTVSLLLKYHGLLKYRDCLGF